MKRFIQADKSIEPEPRRRGQRIQGEIEMSQNAKSAQQVKDRGQQKSVVSVADSSSEIVVPQFSLFTLIRYAPGSVQTDTIQTGDIKVSSVDAALGDIGLSETVARKLVIRDDCTTDWWMAIKPPI